MLEFCAQYPFIQLPINHYAGFAYDGRFTYLSSNDRQIAVCDENNVQFKTIQTNRFYHTICYDPSSDCFFAASQDSLGLLYCLSHEMEEISIVNLDNYHGVIHGLSYVRYDNSFMFFNNDQIYSVNRAGNVQKLENDEKRKGYTLGTGTVEQGLLRLSVKQRHYYMSFFLGQQMWDEEILSRDTKARGMVVYPDKIEEGITCIRIFAVKYRRKSYLLEYKFDARPYFAANQLQGENDFSISEEENNMELNNINVCYPQQCCAKPCCPTSCKPIECCTCDCCESYAKVLESIALAEASIAHILNAEGEKLQKVIQENVGVCELLQVNASVQKTIVCATHLEHTLYNKLEALLQINCQTCPAPCPSPCQNHCKPSNCRCQESTGKRNDDKI